MEVSCSATNAPLAALVVVGILVWGVVLPRIQEWRAREADCHSGVSGGSRRFHDTCGV